MLTWPTELPDFDAADYKLKGVDTTQRTPMEKGAMRSRPTSISAPTMLTGSWTLTNEQATLLDQFYRRALRLGSDAFYAPVWVFGAFNVQQVMFTEIPEFSYFGPFNQRATAKLLVTDDLGPAIWRDVTLDDDDTERAIATLSSQFRVRRVDIFVRTSPDSATTDTLRVGWAGGYTALVNQANLKVAGHTKIVAGHAQAGLSLGVLQDTSLPRTILLKWTSTGTPTKCDVSVVIPYAKE